MVPHQANKTHGHPAGGEGRAVPPPDLLQHRSWLATPRQGPASRLPSPTRSPPTGWINKPTKQSRPGLRRRLGRWLHDHLTIDPSVVVSATEDVAIVEATPSDPGETGSDACGRRLRLERRRPTGPSPRFPRGTGLRRRVADVRRVRRVRWVGPLFAADLPYSQPPRASRRCVSLASRCCWGSRRITGSTCWLSGARCTAIDGVLWVAEQGPLTQADAPPTLGAAKSSSCPMSGRAPADRLRCWSPSYSTATRNAL